MKATAKGKEKEKASGPSSNWAALQKTLSAKLSKDSSRKRRKISHPKPLKPRRPAADVNNMLPSTCAHATTSRAKSPLAATALPVIAVDTLDEMKNGESLSQLRKMIRGELVYTEAQTQPGKYLALDCEMVGVGPEGQESSLARVSLVNFYGAVQLDVFVKQRERVTDWRTQWSGIREKDMVKAKPFEEVQKLVSDLLQDRILVGHAVFNDLKALLLSHPRPLTRDTQYFAGKDKLVNKSKYPALRNLVQQEVGIAIQSGEHSSVTDARATMAVYRLHRKEWEKYNKPLPADSKRGKKRKRESSGSTDEDKEREPPPPPGGGRKGVSSGFSTVVKLKRQKRETAPAASVKAEGGGSPDKWWKSLGGGSKGTFSFKA